MERTSAAEPKGEVLAFPAVPARKEPRNNGPQNRSVCKVLGVCSYEEIDL